MRLSTRVAHNTIIQILNKIASTALGLVAISVITRKLGNEGFGIYTTILTFLSFFGIMADLGLTLVTSQILSLNSQEDENKIFGNLMSFRLFSALFFLGLAPIAVLLFPYSTEIKIGVSITSFAFLFIALNQIMVGFYQKHLQMDKIAISETASKIILIVGVFFSVHFDKGINGILFATVLSSACSFLINYLFSKKLVQLDLRYDMDVWKNILILSWPLAITTTLNLIYLKSDTLFLSLIPRESQIGIISEVGIYGAAYKVIDVLITFPFMFAGIILPVLSGKWAEKNMDNFKKITQKAFDIMLILAIPIIFGTQFIAKDIMRLVAGDEFVLSGPILQILILASALIFIGIIPTHAIIAISKQKKLISFYLFTAISSLIGYLILIPKISYFGAAWITVYSEAVISLSAIFLLWKFIGFLPSLKTSGKAVLASIFMSFTIVAIQEIFNNLAVIIPFSIVSYFGFLYLFKGINKEDILIIMNK